MQRWICFMFAFVSVLENTGACPSCGNGISSLKWLHHPFLHTHHCSLSASHMHIPTCTVVRERTRARAHTHTHKEQPVQMYLTVAAFLPGNIFNNAHSTPVPSQQEATGNRWGLVRLIWKTTVYLYLPRTVLTLATSGLINNEST